MSVKVEIIYPGEPFGYLPLNKVIHPTVLPCSMAFSQLRAMAQESTCLRVVSC